MRNNAHISFWGKRIIGCRVVNEVCYMSKGNSKSSRDLNTMRNLL